MDEEEADKTSGQCLGPTKTIPLSFPLPYPPSYTSYLHPNPLNAPVRKTRPLAKPRMGGESRMTQTVVAVEVEVEAGDRVEVEIEVEAIGRRDWTSGVR